MGGATRFFLLLTTPFPLISPRPSLLRLRLGFARPPRLPPSSLAPLSTSTLSPPSPRRRRLFPTVKSSSQQFHSQTNTNTVGDDHFGDPFPSSSSSSPWPEWSRLVERLASTGYFNRAVEDDEFVAIEGLSDDFVKAARACLSFARDRPNLLWSLSGRDIDVVIGNGSAFLFKNGGDSARKLRTFLGGNEINVLESDKACTVDLMRFLLSYTSNPAESLERNSLYNKELVESSVRSLLREMANAMYSPPHSDLSGSVLKQFPESYGQTSRSFGQNIEMKRGDWVCPRCTFMNFARNVKCLECEEARPKRQLSGGEWECPQCDFFNYGKNLACLRCDCKRPGEVSFSINNSRPGLDGRYTNKVDFDSRLAANEEKAERWFSKVSQLDSTSENSAIADDDFPEIMPLRKGINRFVVSTRKTPLERRLANAEYQRNLGNDGSSEGNNLQTGGTISRSLDDILGRTSVVDAESKSITAGQNAGTESSGHVSRQYGYSKGSSSSYVPFVPLPADTFAKKPQSSKAEESETLVTDNHKSVAPEASEQKAPSSGSNLSGMSGESLLLSQKPVIQMENKDKEKEQAEKSERWFKKVAELHDVTDLASAISDEDFPEIMPMRKGENRFVVSKKKDRSLTSPMYKRRMAMEQTGNTNFVPFVPFPTDYFSKKDNQQSDGAVPSKATGETSGSMTSEKLPEKADYSAAPENLQSGSGNWNSTASEVKLTERKTGAVSGVPSSGNATQNLVSPQTISNNSWSSGYSGKEDTTQTTNMKASVAQPYENRNLRDSWSGKSLEGSAVKETDPLDMSEEAKAERWFRRAAQIKDISELSQIPDEDFPSIMPMRKGVNRFVVSKRKTPLERRLTSPQYRRNLPIVSSEPLKKENDSS